MGSACGSTAARSQWPGSGIRRSIGLQALPLDGGGLGGGDASANTSQEMKRYLPRGAAARARNLRQNMTEAEIRVWRMLRAHRMNGHKFRRQVPIGRYIADFVCHEARLVVEIDGGQHDSSSPRETERSGFLQKEGYRILRFWNNEVLANPDGVHETIVDELAASPPPCPPPSRGRGCSPTHRQYIEEKVKP